MNISLNWLREYIELDVGVDELCDKMTMLGLEIEAVERPGDEILDVVVGEILSIDPHPDADKLVVCKTSVGEGEPLQIVCGAKNMKVGDRVPTAVVGATLPGGFKIGKRKMRGLESQGMMCSPSELGLGEDHDGLLILDEPLEVGQDIRPALGLDDVVLEIEVTPNRNDWSSMIGVARELSAAYGVPFKVPEVTLRESAATKAADLSSVTIEDPDLCPRYVGRILTGATIAPSPPWLAQRLIAAGQRPINNVVDITNFVLMETGHPLHAFDLDKLQERRIVVRRARENEVIKTIDQENRSLTSEILIIADAKAPVAVAGVMGGFDTEVGEGTTSIFLESAYFEPRSIRKTARRLNMISEASQRFQRGADPEMALYAANRAAQLLQEIARADVAAGTLDEYPNPLPQKKIGLRFARTNLLLGADIRADDQRAMVASLGFEILSDEGDSITVGVPTWRHDASQEADLIEEVARLYGYDNIGVTLPRVHRTENVFAPHHRALRDLRNHLVGLGLTEAVNWTFTAPEEVQKARLGETDQSMVTIENPLSENQATMRSSLIPGLLKTASYNLRKNHKDLMAFEIGPVFQPVDGEELPTQRTALGIVLSGNSSEKHWSRPQHGLDFYDLKGYAEAVSEFFDATASFTPSDAPLFAPGHCGTVTYGKSEVGTLGLVSNPVLKAFDIEQPCYILQFVLDPLLALDTKPAQFATIPAYPPSLRDMAVVVQNDVPAGDILDLARKSGGKLLQAVDLFDIYTGKQVPEGKKSVALSLLFQSEERTLTDKDTQKAWDKILRKLKEKHGAELR